MSSSNTLVLPTVAVPKPADLTQLWAGTNLALQQMNRQLQQMTQAVSATKTTVSQDGSSGGTSVNVYPLAANSVGTTQLVDASIINSKVAANAIQTTNILDSAITTLKIANAAVTGAQVAVNTITGGLTGNLAAATVTANNITSATITTSQIAASTILGSNIAASTITGGNIAALTITASNIAAHTITASQILAGTITANEIAANTIVANNIAAGTITSTQIAANTITASNMNVTQLSAISANLGTVTAGTLTSVTITSTSGSIGGFTLGSTTLSAGSGANFVSISNNATTGIKLGDTTGTNVLLQRGSGGSAGLYLFHVASNFGADIQIDPSGNGSVGLSNSSAVQTIFADGSTGIVNSIGGVSSGYLSITGASNIPTGTGMELFYDSASSSAKINAYNRGSSTYLNLALQASNIILGASTSHKVKFIAGVTGGSPASGSPTGWIAVDVNGTAAYLPYYV